MKILSNEELINLNGGGFSFNAIIGISGVITFLIGVLDGIVRPLACRAKVR